MGVCGQGKGWGGEKNPVVFCADPQHTLREKTGGGLVPKREKTNRQEKERKKGGVGGAMKGVIQMVVMRPKAVPPAGKVESFGEA